MQMNKSLGQIVKSRRRELRLTVPELSFKIGISESYLYSIENEHRKPRNSAVISMISNALDLPFADLLIAAHTGGLDDKKTKV